MTGVVSQKQDLSWLPNPVITGAGSQETLWWRRIDNRCVFSLCVPVCMQLWVLSTGVVIASVDAPVSIYNTVYVCGKRLYLNLFLSSNFS